MAPKNKQADEDTARCKAILALTSESGHTLGTWLSGLQSTIHATFVDLRQNHPAAYKDVSEYREIIEKRLRDIIKIMTEIAVFASKRGSVKERFNISKLVRDVVFYTPSSRAKEIDWRQELDFTIPEIYGYWGILKLMLTNLINNAIEAMKGNELVDGKKGVLLLKTRLAKGGKHVEVLVSDTGIGISPENQKKIFDLFFSLKGSSGIGLASAVEVVKLHNGAITCESEISKGTTFTVRLPI